jgi:hypothetical protein
VSRRGSSVVASAASAAPPASPRAACLRRRGPMGCPRGPLAELDAVRRRGSASVSHPGPRGSAASMRASARARAARSTSIPRHGQGGPRCSRGSRFTSAGLASRRGSPPSEVARAPRPSVVGGARPVASPGRMGAARQAAGIDHDPGAIESARCGAGGSLSADQAGGGRSLRGHERAQPGAALGGARTGWAGQQAVPVSEPPRIPRARAEGDGGEPGRGPRGGR